jgi:hypothetical protein
MSATKEHYHDQIEAGSRSIKCKTSNWGCPYHACMTDDCQKNEVIKNNVDFGNGRCKETTTPAAVQAIAPPPRREGKFGESNEHPILFSTEMVKAILEGRKTQTRRVVKQQPDFKPTHVNDRLTYWYSNSKPYSLNDCPFGKPGDLLWVRESFANADNGFCFKVYNDIYTVFAPRNSWKPSIHMPKVATRIWLEVTSVRVERLQEISEADAKAEGVKSNFSQLFNEERYYDYLDIESQWRSAVSSFKSLWYKINGIESWHENPWVWVVEFKVLSTTGRPETN